MKTFNMNARKRLSFNYFHDVFHHSTDLQLHNHRRTTFRYTRTDCNHVAFELFKIMQHLLMKAITTYPGERLEGPV